MAIIIPAPGETIHQNEHELILRNPNFPFEILLPSAVTLFCVVMIGLITTGRYDPHFTNDPGLIVPSNIFLILFLILMSLFMVNMRPVQTICFNKAADRLIVQQSRWLGIHHFQQEFPLSEITEIRVHPDRASDLDNRWTLYVIADSEPYLRLPSSSFLSNYSQEQAEAIASTLRQFLGLIVGQ